MSTSTYSVFDWCPSKPLMEVNGRKLFAQIHQKNSKQCTDLSWLLVFCAMWIIMLVIAVFGVIYGNYLPIINGYDSFGNTCGVKNNKPFHNVTLSGMDTSSKPNLLFMGDSNVSQVLRICVERCLTDLISGPNFLYLQALETGSHLCRYDFDMKVLEEAFLPDYNSILGPCPESYAYEDISVKHRCIPLDSSAVRLTESYAYINVGAGPQQAFFTHVYQAWPYVLVLVFFALVVAAGVLSLMRWKPALTVRVVACLAFVSSVGLAVIGWVIFLRLPTLAKSIVANFAHDDGEILYNFLPDFDFNQTFITGLAVVGVILTAGLLIVLHFTKGDIPRVIVLSDLAVKCWRQVPGLLRLVCVTSAALVVFFLSWTYTILCIATASVKEIFPLGDRADYEDDSSIGLRQFEQVKHVPMVYIRNCFWIYIAGFVWTSEFICICQQFCVETAVFRWYFRRPPVACSFYRHHLGSVARGSLVGMLKIPQSLLAYFCEELEKVADSNSIRSLGRRLDKIERLLRIPHGAYANVAIHTIDLYPAGRMASAMMATSAEYVDDIGNSVYFLFFLARLMVANFTLLLGLLLLNNVENLFFYMAPVVTGTVFAFYIARILLDTVECTLNTLFLCVCEDKRVNKAGGRWSQGEFIQFSDQP